MKSRTWLAAGLLAFSQGASGAGSVDDDLAVVRRAVAAQSAPRPEAPPARAERTDAPARTDKPRWLKVRVQERTGKRLSVNVPLAVARALGDLPVDLDCGRRRCKLTLDEVLRSLDSGQDLVQIEGEDATVRVWVE